MIVWHCLPMYAVYSGSVIETSMFKKLGCASAKRQIQSERFFCSFHLQLVVSHRRALNVQRQGDVVCKQFYGTLSLERIKIFWW